MGWLRRTCAACHQRSKRRCTSSMRLCGRYAACLGSPAPESSRKTNPVRAAASAVTGRRQVSRWGVGCGTLSTCSRSASLRRLSDVGAGFVALPFDGAVDGGPADAERVGDFGGAAFAAVHKGDQVRIPSSVELGLLCRGAGHWPWRLTELAALVDASVRPRVCVGRPRPACGPRDR